MPKRLGFRLPPAVAIVSSACSGKLQDLATRESRCGQTEDAAATEMFEGFLTKWSIHMFIMMAHKFD